MIGRNARPRAAFSLVEITASFALLVAALVLITQVAGWTLVEREQASARQAAFEHAANLLEAARALPEGDLTPAWAASHKLPEALARQLTDGRLLVRVASEAGRTGVKRVTVEIHSRAGDGQEQRPIQLVALVSARTAEAKGGKR